MLRNKQNQAKRKQKTIKKKKAPNAVKPKGRQEVTKKVAEVVLKTDSVDQMSEKGKRGKKKNNNKKKRRMKERQ